MKWKHKCVVGIATMSMFFALPLTSAEEEDIVVYGNEFEPEATATASIDESSPADGNSEKVEVTENQPDGTGSEVEGSGESQPEPTEAVVTEDVAPSNEQSPSEEDEVETAPVDSGNTNENTQSQEPTEEVTEEVVVESEPVPADDGNTDENTQSQEPTEEVTEEVVVEPEPVPADDGGTDENTQPQEPAEEVTEEVVVEPEPDTNAGTEPEVEPETVDEQTPIDETIDYDPNMNETIADLESTSSDSKVDNTTNLENPIDDGSGNVSGKIPSYPKNIKGSSDVDESESESETQDKETQKKEKKKKLKKQEARFVKLLSDESYDYYLDKNAVQWVKMPYSTSEYMADVWIRMIERTPNRNDMPDDVYNYLNSGDNIVAAAAEKGIAYDEVDIKVMSNRKYFLEHYYIRPKTRQIQFLCELEVIGRPQNAISERAYDYKNWENLIPGSVEASIYSGVLEEIGTKKASNRGHMSFIDKLDEYARVALN